MKKLFAYLLFTGAFAFAQAPSIQWQTSTMAVNTWSIKNTPDGGFASFGSTGGAIASDYHIAKHDANGVVLWERDIFDADYIEQGLSMAVTADGGYILAGNSRRDGHSKGIWVVKLDAEGNQVWNTPLGGGGLGITENRYEIIQTSDGGYAVIGDKGGDVYVCKLSAAGGIVWQKSYGVNYSEYGSSIRQTPDGGYITLGQGAINNPNDHLALGEYMLMKLNPDGTLVWQKFLGGTGVDFGMKIELTADGGYIAAGFSTSGDGDVTGASGNADMWIVKLNANGEIQWQKAYGGNDSDKAYSIKPTPDGGYIAVGKSVLNGSWVSGHYAQGNDMWVVKMDAQGTLQWQKCLGGNADDYAYDVEIAPDGGYIIGGGSSSTDGDLTGTTRARNSWIIKLQGVAATEQFVQEKFVLTPNPVNNSLTINRTTKKLNGITVTDITGKTVLRSGGEVSVVDMSGLEKGVYMVRIDFDGGYQSEKIIKR